MLPKEGHTNTHTHMCPFTHPHPYSTPHTHTHIPTHHTPHTHHTPENQPLWNCLSQNQRQIENTLRPTCSSEMTEEQEGERERGRRRGKGEVGRRQRSGQGEGRKADNLRIHYNEPWKTLRFGKYSMNTANYRAKQYSSKVLHPPPKQPGDTQHWSSDCYQNSTGS